MKTQLRWIGATTLGLLAILFVARTQAQTEPANDAPAAQAPPADSVPRAALLTERGRHLAEELRLLKRSRESMGAKHPTLPVINSKIALIEEQLQAWEPAIGAPAENPFHADPKAPQMNEYDLRQIVLQLIKRVEMLEKRVLELESK